MDAAENGLAAAAVKKTSGDSVVIKVIVYGGICTLGLCSIQASAQSSVSISGLLDSGVQRVKNFDGTNTTRLSGGGFRTSRVRFTGTEAIGDDLKAQFHLEFSPALDAGTVNANAFFNRGAWLGLSGKSWGSVRMGRFGVPTVGLVCAVDLHGCGSGFNANGIMYNGTNAFGRWISPNPGRGGNANEGMSVYSGGTTNKGSADSARVSNAISYETPRWQGFQGQLVYALGEAGSNAANGSGNHFGAGLTYASGPWYAGITFEHVAADPQWNAKGSQITIGTHYRVGDLRVGAIYQSERASGEAARWSRASAWALTSAYKLGAFEPYLKLGSHRTNGTGAFGIQNATDSSVVNLGTTYALSKRTLLYADYATDGRGSHAPTAGSTRPSQFMVGINHSF
jgi:predicted porin